MKDCQNGGIFLSIWAGNISSTRKIFILFCHYRCASKFCSLVRSWLQDSNYSKDCQFDIKENYIARGKFDFGYSAPVFGLALTRFYYLYFALEQRGRAINEALVSRDNVIVLYRTYLCSCHWSFVQARLYQDVCMGSKHYTYVGRTSVERQVFYVSYSMLFMCVRNFVFGVKYTKQLSVCTLSNVWFCRFVVYGVCFWAKFQLSVRFPLI